MWILILLSISHQALADILLYFPGEPRPLDVLRSVPSSFGGVIPSTGLKAKIEYASPADGCQLIEPPLDRNASRIWVTLVSRTNCSFELKIRNAQASNYDGIIVHNVGSDDILEMYVENATDIWIPSVFIGETDGFDLRRIFTLHYYYYYIVITDNYPINFAYLFLLAIGVTIVILFFAILARVINSIRHHYKQSPQGQIVSGITKFVMKHKFRGGNSYKEVETCTDINTEEYTKKEQHT